MKKIFLLFILTLILSISSSFSTKAQTTKGTEFWCGFMANLQLDANGNPEFSFIISSDYDTKGKITMPLGSLNIDFSLKSGEVKEIFLPSDSTLSDYCNQKVYYSKASEKTDTFAIKIISEKPINVYAMHYRHYFSDASIVLPVSESGNDYNVIACKDHSIGSRSSELVILGIENNTDIEITPSALTYNQKPLGKSFKLTLNSGQSYQMLTSLNFHDICMPECLKYDSINDITSTTIKSTNNKKFTVFSGAKTAAVMFDYPDNHCWDQDYPITSWGNTYIYVPFKDQGGDIIKILALSDSTLININCTIDTNLNKGGFYQKKIKNPSFITSNNKIAVAQIEKPVYYNANGCGDPSFLILPPINYMNKSAGFKSSDDAKFVEPKQHYVNIITHSKSINNLLLDNANVSNQFKPLTSLPEYSYAQVSIPEGNHHITSPDGFYAYAYGCSYADAYTYHLGYDYYENIVFPGFSLPDTSAKIGLENFKIPFNIKINQEELPLKFNTLHARIRFDKSVFDPVSVLNGTFTKTFSGKYCILDFDLKDVNISNPLQPITEITGTVLNADSNTFPIIIDTVFWDSNKPVLTGICSNLIKQNGSLSINSCARDLSKFVIFKPLSMTIMPNPTNQLLITNYELPSDGNMKLSLFNQLGEEVAVLKNEYEKAGNHNCQLSINDNQLNDGIYFLRFMAGGDVITEKVIIIR